MGLLDGTPLASVAAALPNGLGMLGGLGNSQRQLQTPAAIQRRLDYAKALSQEGSSIAPIASPWAGVARVVDALASVGEDKAAQQSDVTRQAYVRGLLGGATQPAANPYASALAPAAFGSGTADTGSSGSTDGSAPAATAATDNGTFGRMIGAESGGNQTGPDGGVLTSPKGALGIAQIMPGTAPEAAQLAGLPYDPDRLANDAGYNKALGQAYYNKQLETFGSPDKAAAAYNAGPGAMAAALQKAASTGGNYLDFLPAETQAYVAKTAGSPQPSPQALAYASAMGGNPPSGPPTSAMGAIGAAVAPGSPTMGSTGADGGSSVGTMTPIPVGPAPNTPALSPDLAQYTAAGATGSPVATGQSASPPAGLPQGGGAPNRFAVDPQKLLDVMTSPYASPQEQQIAASLFANQANRPSFSYGHLPDGSIFQRNSLTGEMSIVQKSDPQRFEDPRTKNTYGYDANDPKGQVRQLNPQGTTAPLTRPMTPAELKAANLPPDAHTQLNTVTGELTAIPGAAGDDSYSKQLTEGLGKAHAQLANNVEENQAQSRDLNAMQGAIQRIRANGGTTGGLAQQEVLDLKKAINSGANAIGVSQPFSDLSDPEFLTKFNRQIAAAAAATGSNGGRVTNFAIQNMLKANPGLELTPEGNQRLIGIQQQIMGRNVAVGQQIRDATADAYAKGQKVNPGDVEKLIRSYDDQNHIMDPITGQDLTANPTLQDLKKGGAGTPGPQNPGVGVTPQQDGAPASPKTKQDYDALAHGALYVAPDGSTRRKP